jgi:phosphoglucosamine mutase
MDTRESGPEIAGGLSAGIEHEGGEAILVGVLPTPGVAYLCRITDAVAAISISASHNPFEDNGVKLFGPGGKKLDDETEAALEAELHGLLRHEATGDPRTGDAVGTVVDGTPEVARWAASVAGSIGGRRLDGLRVVLDCANGAASHAGPALLRSLGAEVVVLHDEPDGTNINAGCGSTHPGDLQQAVVAHGAAVGIALDGDADRALAVDASGRLIDGDQIIAITAIDRREAGTLADDTVVVTVMTNLGFRFGMADHGIKVLEVPVGDRYVLEALDDGGLSLGGEQSGHVIFTDHATTGDGVLTALHLLATMARRESPLHELVKVMTRLPQVLINVRGVDKTRAGNSRELAAAVEAAQAELGETGRVLIRPSGTEPMVRVMVEATGADQAKAVAERLAEAVKNVL